MRHHVTLARMSCHLELDPEWLDIMVKRYDDAPEDFGSPEEELSMDELQFFVRALRIASWSYSVAGQRLRELQNAMLELRDRETAKGIASCLPAKTIRLTWFCLCTQLNLQASSPICSISISLQTASKQTISWGYRCALERVVMRCISLEG